MNSESMSQEILDKLPDLGGKNLLIFGDVGVDEYVLGSVNRISPEAPVPVVEVSNISKKLGLSANVAANIQSLGGTPLLVAVHGDDREGESLKGLLEEKGISTSHLVSDSGRPTTSKMRVLSGQHHIVRVDYETKNSIDQKVFSALEKKVDELIDAADGIIIQDYAKGMISESSAQMVIKKAKSKNKAVIVDPYRSTPLNYYRGADLMTPNRDEAFELARQLPSEDWTSNVDSIGPALMKKIQAKKMVITLGSEGMKVFSGDKPLLQLPTFARKVFDVTGAGDTVIAAFSLALAAGWNIELAGYLANLAAGVVVGHVGAVACSQTDLKNYIQSHFQ